MSRWLVRIAAMTMLAAALDLPCAQAQTQVPAELPLPGINPALTYGGLAAPEIPQPLAAPTAPRIPAPVSAAPAQFASRQAVHPAAAETSSGAVVASPAPQAGYVRLNAPLYPTPRPNIPIWTGSTVITNQALAPHEMLYAHTYRAMYPPFYHRVKGCYMWTPFGMRTHEKWELQGTMVQVKYRSHWPSFGPSKPWTSTWGAPWK